MASSSGSTRQRGLSAPAILQKFCELLLVVARTHHGPDIFHDGSISFEAELGHHALVAFTEPRRCGGAGGDGKPYPAVAQGCEVLNGELGTVAVIGHYGFEDPA